MIIKNGKRIDGCSDTLPIGTVQPFLGLTPPKGYLLCQGQAVSKITYKELYEICGDTFGTSTETEFYLPDLRGKTIAGYNENDIAMNMIGALIGNTTHKHSTGNHTLTVNEIPQHEHYMYFGTTAEGTWKVMSSAVKTSAPGDYTTTSGVADVSVGQAHNHGDTGEASNYQPTVIMNWIVKAIMTIPVQTSLATSYTDSATDVYSCDYVNEAIRVGLGDNVPAGTVVDYDGEEIPEGWEAAFEDATVYIGPNEPTDGQDIWIQKGKNLFDKNSSIKGEAYGQEGVRVENPDWSRSSFIKVHPNTVYSYSSKLISGESEIQTTLAYWNSDKVWVGETYTTNLIETITTPADCEYIMVQYRNDTLENIQLELGDKVTEYEPYINKKIYIKNDDGKYELFVKNRVHVGPYQPEDGEEVWIKKGKNLIRSFRHDCMYHNGNSAYENSIYGFTATEPIEIELNVPYYFSHHLGVKNGNVNVIDANGVCLEQINPDDMFAPIIITNPNAKKIIINTWDINNNTSTNETWMQLEQGDGVTSYEPYIEPKILIKNNNGVYETLNKDNEWEYARPNDEHTLFTVYTSWDNLKEISIRTLGVESATFGYLTVPKEQWHNQGAYGLQVRCIDGNGYFQGYANFVVSEKGDNYFKITKTGTSTSTQILYKRK